MELGWIHPVDVHHIHSGDTILHGREKIQRWTRLGSAGSILNGLRRPKGDLIPCPPDPFPPGSVVVKLHLVHRTVWLKIAKIRSNGLRQKEGETLIKGFRKCSLGTTPM